MNRNGFTMIETLIYIAIVGLVIGALVQFSITITQTRNQTYVTQEVQSNARRLVETITRVVQESDGFVTSTSVFAGDPGKLVLSMTTPELNPTVVTLDKDDGLLVIVQGASATTTITSDEVRVTNLQFTDTTGAGTRGSIRLMATLQSKNADSTDVTYEQSVQTNITIRK